MELSKVKLRVAEVEKWKKKAKEEKEKRKKSEEVFERDLEELRQKLLSFDKKTDTPGLLS
jgi:hypothetical protein